jgi:hypothetical protein
MGRTALGQVDAPIGAGRDRLQLALGRGRDGDGQRLLGLRIGAAWILGQIERQPVRRQLGDGDAQVGRTVRDLPAMIEGHRRSGDQHALGPPEPRLGFRLELGCHGPCNR